MQGKTNADLAEERELQERKELKEDKMRRDAELEARGLSLADEYEGVSEASQPIDEILKVRAQDPRMMKPG